MEFHETLQALRKQKNLTQEELAQHLFVSRTAISKWESGRGLPSIESLKELSKFYSVSIDQLLSGEQLMDIAQQDSRQKTRGLCHLAFGLMDCAMILCFFFPIFGQRINGLIYEVPLMSLTEIHWYIRLPYLAVVLFTIFWGIAALALQTYKGEVWRGCQRPISLFLSITGSLLFIMTLQPYAATLCFLFLLMKGILLLKTR